ncbi:MAG: CvpA family protein [Clostridiales bacterium]|nr:CvpA family protein [Clostridiales bacterium]
MDNLSIIFDIAVLLIVAICVAIGAKRGFIQTVFRLFSSVISVFIAKSLFPYTKYFLERVLVKEFIKSLVLNKLNLTQGTTEITEYSVNSLNLPNFIKTAFLDSNYLQQMRNDASAKLAQTISEFVADYALTMIAFVITFILVYLVLFFLLVVFDIFERLPVLGFFSAGLGGIVGFFSACLIIWIILAAMNVLLASPDLREIFDALDASIITRMFYKYNPIVSIITSANGGF